MKKEDIVDTAQDTAVEPAKLVKIKHKVTGQEFTVASDSIYATSESYTKVSK